MKHLIPALLLTLSCARAQTESYCIGVGSGLSGASIVIINLTHRHIQKSFSVTQFPFVSVAVIQDPHHPLGRTALILDNTGFLWDLPLDQRPWSAVTLNTLFPNAPVQAYGGPKRFGLSGPRGTTSVPSHRWLCATASRGTGITVWDTYSPGTAPFTIPNPSGTASDANKTIAIAPDNDSLLWFDGREGDRTNPPLLCIASIASWHSGSGSTTVLDPTSPWNQFFDTAERHAPEDITFTLPGASGPTSAWMETRTGSNGQPSRGLTFVALTPGIVSSYWPQSLLGTGPWAGSTVDPLGLLVSVGTDPASGGIWNFSTSTIQWAAFAPPTLPPVRFRNFLWRSDDSGVWLLGNHDFAFLHTFSLGVPAAFNTIADLRGAELVHGREQELVVNLRYEGEPEWTTIEHVICARPSCAARSLQSYAVGNLLLSDLATFDAPP